MQIDTNEMLKVLQHRYPFLLVDKVLDYEYGKSVETCKNISANEPWVQGHFPGNPIYPGVFIIESAAQTGAFLFYDPEEEVISKGGMLASVDSFKFVRVVRPGDQLIIKDEILKKFGSLVKVKTRAFVDGKRVAEGELTYVLG